MPLTCFFLLQCFWNFVFVVRAKLGYSLFFTVYVLTDSILHYRSKLAIVFKPVWGYLLMNGSAIRSAKVALQGVKEMEQRKKQLRTCIKEKYPLALLANPSTMHLLESPQPNFCCTLYLTRLLFPSHSLHHCTIWKGNEGNSHCLTPGYNLLHMFLRSKAHCK